MTVVSLRAPLSHLGLVSLGGTGSIAIACLAHGSAAAASGLLRPLDVLLSIGGKEPASCERAYEMLAAAAGEVDLVVRRRPNANGACRPAGLRATTRFAVLVPKPRPGESLGIVLYKCTGMSPVISYIESGSAAEASGAVRPGDVVLGVGGIAAGGLAFTAHLLSSLSDSQGDYIELLVQRCPSTATASANKREGGAALEELSSRRSSTEWSQRVESIGAAQSWLGARAG